MSPILPAMPTYSGFRSALLSLSACGLLAGCYRASLQTGLRPASEVRERIWAKPFSMADASIAEIAVLGGCPSGVARVESTRTVLDRIAGFFESSASAGVRLYITCAVAPAASEPAGPDTASTTPSRP